MSYVIHYGSEVPETVPVKTGKYGFFIAAALIMACIAAVNDWTDGRLWDVLFPWTQEAVVHAVSEFSLELREGESFRESFVELCRGILDEAKTVS